MASPLYEALKKEPCKCVRCDFCFGSGQITVEWFGYPEDDLESCDECHGSGLSEVCERCQEMQEIEYDEL